MSAVHVGLDIGGTKVHGVAVDETSQVLAETRLATQRGPEGVVDVAAATVRALADRLGVDVSALAGIGVGVPGVVDVDGGRLVHAVNLDVGDDGLALADRLGAATGLAVTVENDVNAAAVGAARTLRLEDVDVAYLSIGTGLAAGLVLRGRLRRGARAAAGEIGHVPVDPAGPPCPCGQRGCLEMLASGTAIAQAWPAGDEPPATALFRAAARGDAAARAVRATVAGRVAEAVRLLVLTVDVDVVVLGGGVAEVGDPLRLAVAEALAQQSATSAFLRSLDLPARVSTVAPDTPVAAIGAALLARREDT